MQSVCFKAVYFLPSIGHTREMEVITWLLVSLSKPSGWAQLGTEVCWSRLIYQSFITIVDQQNKMHSWSRSISHQGSFVILVNSDLGEQLLNAARVETFPYFPEILDGGYKFDE